MKVIGNKSILFILLIGTITVGCGEVTSQAKTMNGQQSVIITNYKNENDKQTKSISNKTPVSKPVIKTVTKDQKFIENIKNIMKDRSGFASIAVYDENTQKTYMYETGLTFKTASIMKISLLADLLHIKGTLTSQQKVDAQNMIEHSDNDAATIIWNENGQGIGMQQFFNNVGMAKTTIDSEGYWAKTLTNAVDQVSIMKKFAYSNSYLTDSQRNYGLSLMENVEADQKWGISSGVPSGINIALKNGWSDNNDGTWRINSVGYIKGQGRNYVIAVLTDEDPTEGYGISTIERISKAIWDTFAS